MNRRGFSLIEVMIALLVLGVGVSLLVDEVSMHEHAARRARAVAAVSRVLDQEMERLRACPDRACLEAAETRTATTAGLGAATESWARPLVGRTVSRGPDGTVEVVISAAVPGLVPTRSLRALMVRPR